jgi:hypothetical protein
MGSMQIEKNLATLEYLEDGYRVVLTVVKMPTASSKKTGNLF